MITVLLATHNGCDTLPRTLDAFCRLERPPAPWKLVVVDNASTDGTGELLSAFGDRLPLTCLYEPRRGKARAINRGIDEIEAGLVVITDDDILPNRDWLTQLHSAAERHPDFSVFGGPILPYWEIEPEPWILQKVDLKITYGVLDDLDEGPCPPVLFLGANMAIRSRILERGCRFNETIGPNGTAEYPMGDEIELLRRLTKAGERAWHVKGAAVHHIVRSQQLTERSILQRAANCGRGHYWLATGRRPGTGNTALRIAIFFLLARAAGLLGFAETRFDARWRMSFHQGVARQRREHKRQKR